MKTFNNSLSTLSMESDKFLYYVGFVLLYVRDLASYITFIVIDEAISNTLLIVGCLFLLIFIFSHSLESIRALLMSFITLIIPLICYIKSGETAPLTTALVLNAVVHMKNPMDVLRFWVGLSFAIIIFLFFGYMLLALIDNSTIPVFYREYASMPSGVRHSLFFAHPNVIAAFLLMVVSGWLYLNYNKIGIVHIMVALFVGIFILFYINSRTSGILLLALTTLLAVNKKTELLCKKRLGFIISVMPILMFIAVYLISGILYSDRIGQLLTGRPSLWHACYENQGISLFGQEFQATYSVDANGWIQYFTTLDCYYASGLYVLGLAVSLMSCYVFYKASKRYSMHGNGAAMAVLLVLVLFGLCEVHACDIFISGPLLLLAFNNKFYIMYKEN